MEILELAKYWYYRHIDNFSEKNISKYKKLDDKINRLEMYLKDSPFNLKNGLCIKDKVLLRLQASFYYGKDFKDYIKELKTGVFKIIWDKEPDRLTWNKYFAKNPTDDNKIDYAAHKRIHSYNSNAKYSIVEMIGDSNTEDKIDEITFNNELRSIHIIENKNLEIVDIIPSIEYFAETYAFYFESKGTGTIRTEQNQEILDDLELLLKKIEPSLKMEFEEFIFSIGINSEDAISLRGVSNQKEDTRQTKKSQNTDDSMSNKYGYSYKEWVNLKKQHQVEILADLARKDLVNNQNDWWNNFKTEFPDGYSTELGRYRDKLKKKDRHLRFKINGLIFYKGKE